MANIVMLAGRHSKESDGGLHGERHDAAALDLEGRRMALATILLFGEIGRAEQ